MSLVRSKLCHEENSASNIVYISETVSLVCSLHAAKHAGKDSEMVSLQVFLHLLLGMEDLDVHRITGADVLFCPLLLGMVDLDVHRIPGAAVVKPRKHGGAAN